MNSIIMVKTKRTELCKEG
jgi:hypothetical protein